MSVTLSLAMIVKNEESNLPRSLEPVKDCFDEIIVVDTGSTDRTAELAGSYGARVLHLDWPDDFAAARNFSINAASGDWIMWLDADNQAAPRDVDLLRSLIDSEKNSILWCTEKVVPQGERLIQKRVFPKNPDVYFSGRVHEQLIHPESFRSVMTPVEIIHWGYEDRAQAREKGARNLALLSRMAESRPNDPYVRYQMGRTLFNLRRFDQALFWLETNGQGPPMFPHAEILKARVLERLGRMDEAREALISLTSRNPDYGPGFHALGSLLYAEQKFDSAAEALNRFFSLGEADALAGMNQARMEFSGGIILGKCLEKIGRPGKARLAYQAARKADSHNPEPILALARLELSSENPREALNLLNDCLKVRPGHRGALILKTKIEAT